MEKVGTQFSLRHWIILGRRQKYTEGIPEMPKVPTKPWDRNKMVSGKKCENLC